MIAISVSAATSPPSRSPPIRRPVSSPPSVSPAGRGSMQADQVCRAGKARRGVSAPSARARAFRCFGSTAANDHFFGPDLAQELDAAFTAAGGNVTSSPPPAFGNDGHGILFTSHLFSPQRHSGMDALCRCVLAEAKSEAARDAPALAGSRLARSAAARRQRAERARNLRDRCATQSLCGSADGAFGSKSGARTTEKARAGGPEILPAARGALRRHICRRCRCGTLSAPSGSPVAR